MLNLEQRHSRCPSSAWEIQHFPRWCDRVFTGLRVQRNTSAKFGRGEDGTIHLEVGSTEDKLKSTGDAKEKYIQRVKVSSKCLPMNKNLKLKRTSYITLKYISYKSNLKKNTFQVQTYYLWYNIYYKYSSIIYCQNFIWLLQNLQGYIY